MSFSVSFVKLKTKKLLLTELMKLLLMHCEQCGIGFEILKIKLFEQWKVVNFAVCPNGHEVNKVFRDRWKDKKLCRVCKMPIVWWNYTGGAKGLCGRDYKQSKTMDTSTRANNSRLIALQENQIGNSTANVV